MKTARILLVSAFILSLSACMSMPFSTMYKMSQFSPLEIEPHDMRVAIRTNEGINIQNGAVQISMNVKSEGLQLSKENPNSHNNEFGPLDIDLKMNVVLSPGIKEYLASILLDGIEDNERVTILSLSEVDAEEMTDTLTMIRKYKAKGLKPQGGFGISMQAQCFGDFSAFEELEVDIFIQVDKQEGYMMFLEDIDIIEEANDLNVNLLTKNKCE